MSSLKIHRGPGEPPVSRAQRRRLEKCAAAVDRITDADRLFFERFPHRQHRLRIAGQAEVETGGALAGRTPALPPGSRWLAAVRNLAPGVRTRLLLISSRDAADDVGEEAARRAYEAARPTQWHEVEAALSGMSI